MKLKPGPRPDLELIQKVRNLYKKGLSYNDILKITGRTDKKTLWRWIYNRK